MAELLGRRCLLIEYGSGSSVKTRLLLRRLQEPAGYVPIDVSGDWLRQCGRALAAEFSDLEVLPLAADFTRPLRLPTPRRRPSRRAVYFPGSTIGNFTPEEAVGLLRRTARLVGAGGALLLGADLRKDPAVIEAAYNDRRGVTAAFNRNLLVRINRELGADFVPERFAHRAHYDPVEGRVEMHLVSLADQEVYVGRARFSFAAGESIHTENSYKYDLPGLRRIARAGASRGATGVDRRGGVFCRGVSGGAGGSRVMQRRRVVQLAAGPLVIATTVAAPRRGAFRCHVVANLLAKQACGANTPVGNRIGARVASKNGV